MGLFGKKTSLGLDIGSGFVKIVEVDRSGDQPEVTRVAMRPLLPDAIVEGEVMDPGLVADTVRSLFERMGTKSRDVITAVGGHDVIIKKIEVPAMPEGELAESIQWEAEQYIPFDINDVNLDYVVLDSDARDTMDVLLVAVKKDRIADYTSVIVQAGKDPVLVDVDVFALQNAFEANYEVPADQVIAESKVLVDVARTEALAVVAYATATEAGHHFSIPGFDDPASPNAPAIPFLRAVVGARVGKSARVAWVRHGRVS